MGQWESAAALGEHHVRGRGEDGLANDEMDFVGRRVVIGHRPWATLSSATCC